jgi:hypothetical protein
MLFSLLALLGVTVFAVNDALAAGRTRLDLLGVVVIAALTAVAWGWQLPIFHLPLEPSICTSMHKISMTSHGYTESKVQIRHSALRL